jgi:hypothetical protein
LESFTVLSGELAPLLNGGTHPGAEQEAIAAGFYWWTTNSRTALASGATISVHLKDRDEKFYP